MHGKILEWSLINTKKDTNFSLKFINYFPWQNLYQKYLYPFWNPSIYYIYYYLILYTLVSLRLMEILPSFVAIDAEPLTEYSHLISKKCLCPGLGNLQTSM